MLAMFPVFSVLPRGGRAVGRRRTAMLALLALSVPALLDQGRRLLGLSRRVVALPATPNAVHDETRDDAEDEQSDA